MIRFHRRSNRIEIKSNRILLIVLDSYLRECEYNKKKFPLGMK